MTAYDLLQKLLEYRHDWTARDRERTPSATIRRAQLDALQAAIGLTKQHANLLARVRYWVQGKRVELSRAQHLRNQPNLEFLVQGEFLLDRPAGTYEALTARARARVAAGYAGAPADRLARPVHMGWLYTYLLEYRQALYAVTQPERGMVEGCEVGVLYGQELVNAAKETAAHSAAELDAVLWEILDPSKREVALEELVRTYQYPNVALDRIDLAWRMEQMENY